MSLDSLGFIGFMDSASCHTQILSSISWVIYSPTFQLVTLEGDFLGIAKNNMAKYKVVIEMLSEII
jgi:hypothetical protein